MAASWPKQRFVGLRAERVPGGFLTPVFYLQAPEMRVDANVRGWLRAELCDAWGRKHEGYHLEDSIPAQGDDQAHILRWHGQAEAEANPQPQAVQEAETAEAEL